MKLFDRRHRWGEPRHVDARIERTCLVCGRTDSAEQLVPDAFIAEMVRIASSPNPLRSLMR